MARRVHSGLNPRRRDGEKRKREDKCGVRALVKQNNALPAQSEDSAIESQIMRAIIRHCEKARKGKGRNEQPDKLHIERERERRRPKVMATE